MSTHISAVRRVTTRRLAAALALAAVVTLGISVAAPTDAASAASTSTRTYSAEGGASAAGFEPASDRRLPTGRLYIAPRYLDREYTGGPAQAATDVCNSYHLGHQCFNSMIALLQSDRVKEDDCQIHGMDAVIPYIQYSRCRKR